jgi:hypothetical protein
MHRRTRRIIAGVLIAAGALVMLLTPDRPLGLALLAAAVVLEFVGIALEQRR